MKYTVGGHKLDNLVINSTVAVAAKVRVNPALPAKAVVEFMAKWLNLYPLTVSLRKNCIIGVGNSTTELLYPTAALTLWP